MPSKFIIWDCCSYNIEDTLDEALGLAYAIDGGDRHSFCCIECPDGRIIEGDDTEYLTYEKAQRAREKEWRAQESKPIAIAHIKRPSGVKQFGYCYSEAEIREVLETFGADRVTIERKA